jgi:hypothetical protein
VTFKLNKNDLGYYDHDMNYLIEAGEFEIFIGESSSNLLSDTIALE